MTVVLHLATLTDAYVCDCETHEVEADTVEAAILQVEAIMAAQIADPNSPTTAFTVCSAAEVGVHV